MKKFCIIAILLASFAAAYAQHPVNPFFDAKGVARVQTVEYSEAPDTIITTFHRMDDIIWSKTVYRIIDLRYKQNFQLYFPANLSNPNYRSLFKVILDAVVDGMEIYPKSDRAGEIRPDFANREPLTKDQIPNLLNTDKEGTGDDNIATSTDMLINYDSIADVMSCNPYKFEEFAKNQFKYIIQEMIFFDRRTSRFHLNIMAIAPLWADNMVYGSETAPMDALYGQLLFWVPFDELRPYMAMQYAIPIQNETKRVTFDEFFQKRLYSSYLLGEENMYDRMIPVYALSLEDIKKEQARIEDEMLTFEQDLWEY